MDFDVEEIIQRIKNNEIAWISFLELIEIYSKISKQKPSEKEMNETESNWNWNGL